MNDIQEIFENNADELSNAVVDRAVEAGVKRAEFWQYPLNEMWTTTVKVDGYELEVHHPKGAEKPGILNFRKVSG